jgi:hypothetical protein|tara:strand:- start:126 stop:383 length:258 start_codon:yes stop_codon:yes gene_type:complete
MSDYTRVTLFEDKDALLSGNTDKIIKGQEFGDEFLAVQTAVNSKADKAGPTFTGTVTAENITISNTLTAANIAGNLTGTISGGTY